MNVPNIYGAETIPPDDRPLINGKPPEVAAHSVVYAIGDIHGRLDLLRALYDQIERDAHQQDVEHRVIVHLGDYIDRGPNTKDVIDTFCTTPLSGFENHWLLGNHEHDMLQFLDGVRTAARWLSNGGRETLGSYGITLSEARADSETLEQVRSELAANLPPDHLQFLNTLEQSYENGDYLFVHAGLRPGVSIEAQSAFDMLWIRRPFLTSTEDFGKIVVHGHSPHRRPETRSNRIGIDTGAYRTGHLTSLILRDTKRHFLQT